MRIFDSLLLASFVILYLIASSLVVACEYGYGDFPRCVDNAAKIER